jgi:hypothetical protein
MKLGSFKNGSAINNTPGVGGFIKSKIRIFAIKPGALQPVQALFVK